MAQETRAVISYDDLEPSLSSDEMLILQALDGSHKYAGELRAKMVEDDSTRGYSRDVAAGRIELTGIKQPSYGAMTTMSSSSSGSGGYIQRAYPHPMLSASNDMLAMGAGPEGGFIQAILPFALPLLGGLIGPAISLVKSLFSKKGSGPVGGADGILEQFFARNKERFQAMEQDLANARGKDFFAKAKQIVKQETRAIVPMIANVTPKIAEHVAEIVTKKVIPTSLQSHVGSGRRAGKASKQGGSLISSLGMTIAKWGASKLLKNSKVARGFASKIHAANNFIEEAEKRGSGMSGGKLVSSAPQYAPPPTSSQMVQYAPPPMQYAPPPMQYAPPPMQYQPPPMQYMPSYPQQYPQMYPVQEKGFFDRVKDRAKSILNAVLPGALRIGEDVAAPLIQGVVDKFANSDAISNMINAGVSGFRGAVGFGTRPPNARSMGYIPSPRRGAGARPPNGRGKKKASRKPSSKGNSYTVRVL